MEFVYILKCSDDTLYTGWTNDINRRLKAHNQGKGAKYTRNRGPVELVHLEIFEDRIEAQGRERAIKRLSRMQKLHMIKSERQASEAILRDNGIDVKLGEI